MLEKWEKSVDMGKTFATLLTEFLIDLTNAKFNVYGFISSSARLIHNYFSDKKQRTKIHGVSSSLQEILFGLPQGFYPWADLI